MAFFNLFNGFPFNFLQILKRIFFRLSEKIFGKRKYFEKIVRNEKTLVQDPDGTIAPLFPNLTIKLILSTTVFPGEGVQKIYEVGSI